MQYSDYKCFQLRFDSGVAFVSINHPPINLLDEVLSQEFDKLGRELEADESVRVVVLQSALPDFFIAHSGLSRVGTASKMVSPTRSFRLTQTIGERFRNMPKVTIAKIEGRARGGGSEIGLAVTCVLLPLAKRSSAIQRWRLGLFRAAALRNACHGLSGGDAPWRCSWVAMISRRSWQNVTAISIQRSQRPTSPLLPRNSPTPPPHFLLIPSLTPRRPCILELLVPWQRGFWWKPMSPI